MEAKRVRKNEMGVATQIGLDDYLYECTLRICGTFVLLRTQYMYFNAYWNMMMINLMMKFYFKIVE